MLPEERNACGPKLLRRKRARLILQEVWALIYFSSDVPELDPYTTFRIGQHEPGFDLEVTLKNAKKKKRKSGPVKAPFMPFLTAAPVKPIVCFPASSPSC